jgi:putative Mg2+ transporter-C (MgtC) family protein
MLPDWELILRLLLAALLGSAIGIERERLLWAAGLRTHMLVCVGSCLIMIVSAYGFTAVIGPRVILDPSRIAAQVVSGVGFLGAGSIILRNEVVKGLTTAASLWAVAGLGLAVGGGLYVAAGAATVIILIILAGIKPLEERFRSTRQSVEIHLRTPSGAMSVGLLQQVMGWRASRVKQLVVRPADEIGIDDVALTLGALSSREIGDVVRTLENMPQVSRVREVRGDS